MKKFHTFVSILCVLTYSNLFSAITSNILNFPQGHVQQDLTGKGFLGSTQSSISNMNAGNPASISDFDGLNIGGSFQFETEIKEAWVYNISHYRNNYLPQSMGISYSIKNIHFALASNQTYNTTTDYGNITGTMVWDNEDGYIETGTFHAITEETNFKNSAISAIEFNNFLFESSVLSIGVQFNSNYYTYFQTLGKSYVPLENGDYEVVDNEIEKHLTENNIAIGFTYFLDNDLWKAKLGMYYESELEFDEVKKISGESYQFHGSIPQKLHAGLSINFPQKVTLTNNFSYLYWESTDNLYHTKNELDWSGSVSYHYFNNLSVHIGSKITGTQYDNELVVTWDEAKIKDLLFAHYLTTGCVYNFKNFEFDLAVADSHLFSEDWRKHTIFKLGIGYHFDL